MLLSSFSFAHLPSSSLQADAARKSAWAKQSELEGSIRSAREKITASERALHQGESSACCLLPSACCLLPSACCRLPASCLLPASHSLSLT